ILCRSSSGNRSEAPPCGRGRRFIAVPSVRPTRRDETMSSDPETPFPEHLKMPPTPVLETARLILRPPRESDTPVVQRRFPQWEIVRYLHAKVPWPYPEYGAAAAMTPMLAAQARGKKS